MVHIFRESWQPFTDFMAADIRIANKPGERFACHECGDTRQAKNLEVQAYYDHWRIRCKNGDHPGWR
jgi:hypothetical protein